MLNVILKICELKSLLIIFSLLNMLSSINLTQSAPAELSSDNSLKRPSQDCSFTKTKRLKSIENVEASTENLETSIEILEASTENVEASTSTQLEVGKKIAKKISKKTARKKKAIQLGRIDKKARKASINRSSVWKHFTVISIKISCYFVIAIKF